MRAHGKGARKEIENDIGSGAGGHVVVVRLAAQQQIAHAAAGEVGLIASVAQNGEDLESGVELCAESMAALFYCRPAAQDERDPLS